MNEIAIGIVAALFAIIGFFVAKSINKVDETSGETGKLRERIGQLEMQILAAFREIDHQKDRIRELREDLKDKAS